MALTAFLRRACASTGVREQTCNPNPSTMQTPLTPSSTMVGTSGNNGERTSPVVASATSCPLSDKADQRADIAEDGLASPKFPERQ